MIKNIENIMINRCLQISSTQAHVSEYKKNLSNRIERFLFYRLLFINLITPFTHSLHIAKIAYINKNPTSPNMISANSIFPVLLTFCPISIANVKTMINVKT